jgi:hypothetical protein
MANGASPARAEPRARGTSRLTTTPEAEAPGAATPLPVVGEVVTVLRRELLRRRTVQAVELVCPGHSVFGITVES